MNRVATHELRHHRLVVANQCPACRAKFTFHSLSVVLSAQLNLETGLSFKSDVFKWIWRRQHGTSASQRWWLRRSKCDRRWQREATIEMFFGDGTTRRGSRTARSTVRARVGGVPAQLGGDEGAGARARVDCGNLLGGQRGGELASATGGARAALPGDAVQEDRGQGRVDTHRVLLRSGYSPT